MRYLWIIAFIALMFWGWVIYHNSAENNPQEQLGGNLALVGGNSLVAVSPIVFPKTIVNASLINCLIRHESSGRIDAVGKAGEKGILQFMETTFQQFCIDRYGLSSNIWNPNTQKVCADKMISEDFDNVYHWTTYSFCD